MTGRHANNATGKMPIAKVVYMAALVISIIETNRCLLLLTWSMANGHFKPSPDVQQHGTTRAPLSEGSS